MGEAGDPERLPRDYTVSFAGTTDRYVVKYKGKILRKNFAKEGLASRWAANHAESMKR